VSRGDWAVGQEDVGGWIVIIFLVNLINYGNRLLDVGC